MKSWLTRELNNDEGLRLSKVPHWAYTEDPNEDEGWDANGSPVPGPVLNDRPSWALPDVTIQTPSTESAGRQFTIHKKAPGCDCGAVHTSNPNHHSDWCSIKA